MLSQVVELIENKQFFGITTHVRPDGDGIGSSLGLCWLLRSLGKTAEVIVSDAFPVSYQELPGAKDIRLVTEIDREYDAVFVIECSDIIRPEIKNLDQQFTVNIDHHATCEHFGTVNWIDSTASAVGEMIYNLCKAIGGRVTKEIADCVYLALVADTGSFHYSNTTDRTLKVASELVKVGVKPAEISEMIYNSFSWGRIELMREVLNTVRRDDSGRVAFMRQTLEMKRLTGAINGDNSNFVNLPLMAKEVEAVVYMREISNEMYRVSLRSKGEINVAKIAEKFGGGGHKNASGCTMSGDWDLSEKELVTEIAEAVSKSKRDELELTFA